MKKCTKCKIEKTFEYFNKHKRYKDGYAFWCRECFKQYRIANKEKINTTNKNYWLAHKKEKQIYQRERYLQNRQLILAQNKKYNNENKEKRLKNTLKRDFGIDVELYNQKLSQQGNCCDICKIHISALPKRLAIDHNHETGKIRGLLCNRCNIALGGFKDNIQILENALVYLNSWENNNQITANIIYIKDKRAK